MKTILFVALGLCSVVFTWIWIAEIRRSKRPAMPSLVDSTIGMVMLFFDTLGIGAFATTTAAFKLFKLVRDEDIPGTLNIGIALPSVAEGLIYMSVVDVDIKTLTLMIVAAAAGSWFGAGLVSRWPRRTIQIGMGTTLLVTAGFLLATQLGLLPAGGDLLGLTGFKLVIAVVANALLGALMTLGIGFFAPCMTVIYLLGMSPRVAFPIMMGSCAFLGTVGSIRFIQERRYRLPSAMGITLGGIPGVLLAAYMVKELPLRQLRWLVFVVMLYTAFMMLRSAVRERNAARRAPISVEPAELRT